MNVQVTDEKSVFNIAVNIACADARKMYLDQACAGHPKMRQRIEVLLQMHDEEPEFLERSAETQPTSAYESTDIETSGTLIGPYKLLEVIGEGGMGTVYMAEQTEPVRRRVALKLIKTGMDTRQVINRFEAERQALALMDHPNIAKVLDAGATDSGRPYFVMELVKGKPVTKFCDEQQLDLNSRLMLFQQVCHAVQHAHQKGIIHRDIKPSNILVAMYDDRPVPKVIDFGVAKATGEALTQNTMFTRFGQIVGTLEYMSPEQAQFNQLDIDTRSDIYSLGAVLYELLTGEPPFDREKIKSQALDETLRMIREDEPTRPSTQLDSAAGIGIIASNRKTTGERLRSNIQCDLDWIVMKALEKDRSRRYQNCADFSLDVQRFLDRQPVMAAPPSLSYRIQKYVRRNRTAVFAASCVGLALALGVLSTSIGLFWAVKERNRAENRLNQVVKGNEILTSIFKDLDISKIKDGPDPLEAVLARRLIQAGKQLDAVSIGEPLMVATMQHRLSESLLSLGFAKEAIALGEKSLGTRLELLGPRHRDTLESKVLLGSEFSSNQQHEKALSLLETTLAISRETLGTTDEITRECMNNLAAVYYDQGRSEEAEVLVEEARDLAIECSDRQRTFVLTHNLGWVYLNRGLFDKSLKMFEDALELQESMEKPDNVDKINAIIGLGTYYFQTNQLEKAIPYFEESLQIAERILGSLHPITLKCLQHLSVTYWQNSQFDKSLTLHAERVRRNEVKFGRSSRETQMASLDLAVNYRDVGRLDEAEEVARNIVELRSGDPDHAYPLPMDDRTVLASILAQQGRYGEAVELQRKAVEDLKKINGPDDNRTLTQVNEFANYVLAQGQYEEAERMFEELLDTRKRVSGPNHQETVICMVNLAATLRRQHRFDEAETLLRDAIEIQRKSDRQSSQPTLAGLANLAGTLASQNRLDEAETAILEVLNTANKMNRSNHPNNLAAKVIHARIKERQGKYHEAEQLYSSALQEEKRVLSPDHPITQTTARRLIGVRYGVPQNWKKAAEEFGNLNRDIAENLYCQAISLLGDGDIEGYQRVRDEIETRFGNREDPSAQYIVVWTRVLQPIPVESAKSAVELAESLANIPPSDIHRIAMAATQVRCHKIPDGIDNLKKLNHEWETAEHKPASYSPATIRYFLALAFAKQADFEQARKWLDQANQQNAKESGARNAPVTWEVRLVNQLLQSEVEGMISAEN